MIAEFQAWWEREGCRIVGDPVDYASAAFEAAIRTGRAEGFDYALGPFAQDAEACVAVRERFIDGVRQPFSE